MNSMLIEPYAYFSKFEMTFFVKKLSRELLLYSGYSLFDIFLDYCDISSCHAA